MIRQLRRRPAATLAALVTLALGAGLNLALFRVVYAVMLKPLPYEDPQRLVNLWRVDRLEDSPMMAARDRLLPDGVTVERWRQRSHTLSGLASYRPWRVTVASGGDPERVPAGLISPEFLPLLGVRPAMGRNFEPAENLRGAAPVAILSYAYWRRRFQGDPHLAGASIAIDGQAAQVVGILPAGFRPVIFGMDREAEVYVPLVRADAGSLNVRVGYVVGRLEPGATLASAQAELAALAREAATEQGKRIEQQGVNVLMEVSFRVPGQPERKAGARVVGGDYFQVMGLRMKEGRPLTAADDARRDVVVVNETFVRQFLPRRAAVGAPVDFFEGHIATIVGVVKDLRNMGLQRPAVAEIYAPFGSMPGTFLDTIVRTSADPAGIVAAARAELKQMDPQLALAQVSSMDKIVDDSLARPRFQAVLLGLFAMVALLLAAVGAYGVIAQSVRARTAEFGIRMALGAGAGDVYGLVLWQGLRMPLIGLLAGGAGSLAAGRLLESLLYGVTPRDAQVLAGATLLLAAVAVLACSLSARQAARTDPATALRAE